MAYNALNNLIDAYIYANGVQAITGQILNGVLKQMVSQLGSGYHLMGVAGPETVPASNDYAMAYFAATAGEYTDFGGITLAAGEVAILLTSGNGSWSKETIYNVPTGTADLENTANFITNAVTDLVNYYTKTEVDDTLANYPTLEGLATALADYYDKTEVETLISSAGNGEDIDSNPAGKLQFANRTYNSLQPNGMGYKILRKDATFASQVTDTNTIYEIRYDFILSADFTIPANCVLRFNGGSISGAYTLTGSETKIEAGVVQIFNSNVTLSGTWMVGDAFPEWFGVTGDEVVDDALTINACISAFNKCLLTKRNYYTTQTINLIEKSVLWSKTKDVNVYYKGTTDCIKFSYSASEAIIRNITFYGDATTYISGNTTAIHFNDSVAGRGFVLENIYVAYFRTGVKSAHTLWGTFFKNCKFAFCGNLVDLYDSLNILFSGCYFSTPIDYSAKIEGCRNMTFENCNFGCETEGGKFLYIATRTTATFINCNFEVCKLKNASGCIFIYGGSIVEMFNCLFHKIERDTSFTGNLVVFYEGGNNPCSCTLLDCRFQDIPFESGYRTYILFTDRAVHKFYMLNNKVQKSGTDTDFANTDVFSPDMSSFQELMTKTLGTT